MPASKDSHWDLSEAEIVRGSFRLLSRGSHCNLCNLYDNQELELLLFCSSYRDGTLYVVVTHMIYLEFYCFHSVFLFNICNCNPSVHILANVNIVRLDLLRVKMFK